MKNGNDIKIKANFALLILNLYLDRKPLNYINFPVMTKTIEDIDNFDKEIILINKNISS